MDSSSTSSMAIEAPHPKDQSFQTRRAAFRFLRASIVLSMHVGVLLPSSSSEKEEPARPTLELLPS